jgi:hypothetical protein
MAKKAIELQFSIPNRVGGLEAITSALKSEKINILHMAAWVEEGEAFVNMVVNNNAKAVKALKKIGATPMEKEVLIVTLQNRVGSLNQIATKLAKANIDIKCLTATSGVGKVAVLLSTDDNTKAAKVA